MFRARSERAHATGMLQVETALAGPGAVFGHIEAAFLAFQQGLMEEITASAHGQELFDANMALAGDITVTARTKLAGLLTDALAQAEMADDIALRRLDASAAQ